MNAYYDFIPKHTHTNSICLCFCYCHRFYISLTMKFQWKSVPKKPTVTMLTVHFEWQCENKVNLVEVELIIVVNNVICVVPWTKHTNWERKSRVIFGVRWNILLKSIRQNVFIQIISGCKWDELNYSNEDFFRSIEENVAIMNGKWFTKKTDDIAVFERTFNEIRIQKRSIIYKS